MVPISRTTYPTTHRTTIVPQPANSMIVLTPTIASILVALVLLSTVQLPIYATLTPISMASREKAVMIDEDEDLPHIFTFGIWSTFDRIIFMR